MKNIYDWPYENEFGLRETVESDLLVLGGGLAGCFAAIAAARRGQRVVLVEKGATERSGSAGSGFDHWESACTNPCSGVTPKEIAEAYVEEQDGYSNGIAHYIECREGYDRLLDLEDFGGKIRDTEGELKGAGEEIIPTPPIIPSNPEAQTPTGVEETEDGQCPNGVVLMNGQLFIRRDGKVYNLHGTEVR